MFERFTKSARDTVVNAQAEARALGHDYIGTEHLLLGVACAPGHAARVLAEHGATPEALRAAV
ncbi:MAG: Clp protease N-terminal domain-containing protein, partial [Solirubrobacteraceae bacterium]